MKETMEMTFNKEELEIMKRGVREMKNKYKMAFAEAHSLENEAKQYARVETATKLLGAIEDALEALTAEPVEETEEA